MRHKAIEIEAVETPIDFNSEIHCAVTIDGKIVFLDIAWKDFVLNIEWYSSKVSKYFATRIRGQLQTMHRIVNGTQAGFVCDHINRNSADNRSSNLREVSWSQNNANRVGSTEYRGVRLKKGRYEVSITFRYKTRYIGRFENIDDAIKAYDLECVRIFGKFGITNMPIENYVIPAVSLSQEISAPLHIKRDDNRKPCKLCSRLSVGVSGFCKSHLIKSIRHLAAEKEGRIIAKYADRVKASTATCTREGCDKKTFARNLCDTHWRESKSAEGTYKRAPKIKYYCTTEGCSSPVHLAKLCRRHHRIAFDNPPKPLGRPAKEKGTCALCSEPEEFGGFCKLHNSRYVYYSTVKREVSSREEFIVQWKEGRFVRKPGVPAKAKEASKTS